METTTKPKKPNLNTMQAGDIVQDSYMGTVSRFEGFSGIEEKYGEGGAIFNNLKEAKAAYECRTNAELENVENTCVEDQYGHSVYAILTDLEDGQSWRCYLYNGRWALGSSATTVSFQAPDAMGAIGSAVSRTETGRLYLELATCAYDRRSAARALKRAVKDLETAIRIINAGLED